MPTDGVDQAADAQTVSDELGADAGPAPQAHDDAERMPAETAEAAVAHVEPVAAPAPAPMAPVMAAPAPVAPVMAAPMAPPAPPKVEPFVLQVTTLEQVAQSAGLQWVNSDAEKIRQVQAAIAAEPPPVHVPRERKPLAVADEGPLVQVETRRDLSQVKLPFEQAGS
jgi:ribonuclease E